MDNHYKTALQYANTQGYIELRKIIAQRYKSKENINVEADDILIINGAQQGFDIISSVTLNDNDNVIVEAPTFLAAIQTFNLYNAKIHSVEINDKGINLDELKNILKKYKSKLFKLLSLILYSELLFLTLVSVVINIFFLNIKNTAVPITSKPIKTPTIIIVFLFFFIIFLSYF